MCGTTSNRVVELPKFKIGDKVVLKENAKDIGTVDTDSMVGAVLEVIEVESNKTSDTDYYDVTVRDDSGEKESFKTQQLEYASGFDGIAVDDILIGRAGNEYTVLAKTGRLVALSIKNKPTEFSSQEWYTEEDLKSFEFTQKKLVKDDTKEVTIEEVAEKFGVDTSKIRIKE